MVRLAICKGQIGEIAVEPRWRSTSRGWQCPKRQTTGHASRRQDVNWVLSSGHWGEKTQYCPSFEAVSCKRHRFIEILRIFERHGAYTPAVNTSIFPSVEQGSTEGLPQRSSESLPTDPVLNSRGRERRRLPRFKAAGPCRVSVFDGVENLRGAGVLRDVSAEGIGVRTAVHCLPGMTIQIFVGQDIIMGEVRHCTPNSAGTYDVGVLIETVLSDKD